MPKICCLFQTVCIFLFTINIYCVYASYYPNITLYISFISNTFKLIALIKIKYIYHVFSFYVSSIICSE